MYKTEKTVSVVVNDKGMPTEAHIGWAWKPVKEYDKESNSYIDTGETEKVFGYCDSIGYLTHMCYTLNTHHHETWQAWMEELAQRAERTGIEYKDAEFFFDMGSNGRPISIKFPELERGMRLLDLIK